ncbi:MAG: hypothetical protein RL701_7522, partial [Pseudomonadota bacterium]
MNALKAARQSSPSKMSAMPLGAAMA